MTDFLRTSDAVVEAAEGIATAELDGELILLHVNSGHYYGVNEVGARIMGLLETPTSVTDLCDTLFQEYEVEAQQLEQDVMAFLAEMQQHQLVRSYGGSYHQKAS